MPAESGFFEISEYDRMPDRECVMAWWHWTDAVDILNLDPILTKLIAAYNKPGILRRSGNTLVLDQYRNSQMDEHKWYMFEQQAMCQTRIYLTTNEQVVYCRLIS
jgi:hypothetical protein